MNEQASRPERILSSMVINKEKRKEARFLLSDEFPLACLPACFLNNKNYSPEIC